MNEYEDGDPRMQWVIDALVLTLMWECCLLASRGQFDLSGRWPEEIEA